MPCISVEGFEEQTDQRRGVGHFRKVLSAFENLRSSGVPFGFSATATRSNSDILTSDEFVDFYAKQGASVGWYFQYMPVGREPKLDLMPTPAQRMRRYERLLELRQKFDMLLADFWNDGPLVGGCIAGGRRYLHVNHTGNVEPCVFCQISDDSIYEKSLLEILRTSKLFSAIRRRQPYSENLLRPCMIIDNPEALREIVEEVNPKETCASGARRLVGDLYPQMQRYALEWKALADKEWAKTYAVAYQKPLAEARRWSLEHDRRHTGVSVSGTSDEEGGSQPGRATA